MPIEISTFTSEEKLTSGIDATDSKSFSGDEGGSLDSIP